LTDNNIDQLLSNNSTSASTASNSYYFAGFIAAGAAAAIVITLVAIRIAGAMHSKKTTEPAASTHCQPIFGEATKSYDKVTITESQV